MKQWFGMMAAIAAMGVSGCGFDPLGAEPWSVPPSYRVWWERTEACSGRAGSFEAVQWFIVPGEGFDCPSGTCAGRWEPGRIYLASAFASDEMVVRHEMLHALLDRNGHPNPPFGVGCPLTWETWGSAARARPGTVID
jgi:hypothetical protein